MSNPDNYIEGTFDPNAPFNQSDLRDNQIDCISDALDREASDEQAIALDIVSEIRKEVNLLRELLKQTNIDGKNDFVINKLTKIHNKL